MTSVLLVFAGKPEEKAVFPIKIQEDTNGIAGTSVIVWTVDKDGKWTRVQYTARGGAAVEGTRAEKSGTLTPADLAKLTAALKTHDPHALPKKLGTPPKINAHTYVVEIGSTKVTLEGVSPRLGEAPGTDIRQAAPAGDDGAAGPWRRAAAIVRSVTAATAPD